MKLSKKFLIASMFMTVGAFMFAQVQTVGDYEEEEASVESAYLDDFMGDAIAALADADDFESKYNALQYIREALDNGNTSPAVIESLNRLAGEGIRTQNRENGRVTNNYPEIRRDACRMLAEVPTQHSVNTLIAIGNEDKEPMVGAQAIYALGEIAEEVGCVDEAIEAIEFFNTRNWALNPTSSFATEVLIAFSKLQDSASPEVRDSMLSTLVKIAGNYNYSSDIRKRAQIMLMDLSKGGKASSSKSEVSEK